MICHLPILSYYSTYCCCRCYHQYHLFYTWLPGTFISLLIAVLLRRAIIYAWSRMRPSLDRLWELQRSKNGEFRKWMWIREGSEGEGSNTTVAIWCRFSSWLKWPTDSHQVQTMRKTWVYTLHDTYYCLSISLRAISNDFLWLRKCKPLSCSYSSVALQDWSHAPRKWKDGCGSREQIFWRTPSGHEDDQILISLWPIKEPTYPLESLAALFWWAKTKVLKHIRGFM